MDAIKLFPFQQEGADWLTTMRLALLADDMGLGKSGQAIRAADAINAERIIVTCPAVARPNWFREFDRFSDMKRPFEVVESFTSTLPRDRSIIISYDLAAKTFDTGVFDLFIGDEWHFLKSIEARRSQNIIGKNGLIHKSRRTWALSGTPAPNHAGELWLTLFLFGATRLTYEQFVERYCITMKTEFGIKILGNRTENIPELKGLLKTIMLRRKKQDVLKDLPPITYTDQVVEAAEVDLEINQSFTEWVIPEDRRDELRQKLEREMELLKTLVPDTPGLSPNLIQALEATAPSVSTLRRYTGLQIVPGVVETIKSELAAGAYKKIVIFAIHRDVIERLREGLKDYGAVTIYGGTPAEKRQRHIDNFQNNPQCKVIICNILAAGTAITLTAADHVDVVEPDWVPGNNAQAIMRVHRIGQTSPVFVRFWALANSVHTRVNAALKRKTRDLTAIFDN